jgi:hypothetical protein
LTGAQAREKPAPSRGRPRKNLRVRCTELPTLLEVVSEQRNCQLTQTEWQYDQA